MGRKSLSKKVRFDVFKRDSFRCQYCGKTPPGVTLEVDHVVPVSAGGTNGFDNLLTSCFDCNRGKGADSLTAVPESVSQRHARQKELLEQSNAYNEFLMEKRDAEDEAIHRLGENWFDRFMERGRFVFGDGRAVSIRTFMRWLTEAELIDVIDIAFSRFRPRGDYDAKTWKYFCGVCWNKVRGQSAD